MSRKKMPTWESISYEFANQVTTKNLFCIPTMIINLKNLRFIGQISYNITDDVEKSKGFLYKIPFQRFRTFERWAVTCPATFSYTRHTAETQSQDRADQDASASPTPAKDSHHIPLFLK